MQPQLLFMKRKNIALLKYIEGIRLDIGTLDDRNFPMQR